MKWGKARKKPVVVQFRETQRKTLIRRKHFADGSTEEVWGEVIDTLEGFHEAYVGRDYIIMGVKGELYPIKKDIFTETYDVVESPR